MLHKVYSISKQTNTGILMSGRQLLNENIEQNYNEETGTYSFK